MGNRCLFPVAFACGLFAGRSLNSAGDFCDVDCVWEIAFCPGDGGASVWLANLVHCITSCHKESGMRKRGRPNVDVWTALFQGLQRRCQKAFRRLSVCNCHFHGLWKVAFCRRGLMSRRSTFQPCVHKRKPILDNLKVRFSGVQILVNFPSTLVWATKSDPNNSNNILEGPSRRLWWPDFRTRSRWNFITALAVLSPTT